MSVLLSIAIFGTRSAFVQDNYEIHVYGSDTVAPKTTMVEYPESSLRTASDLRLHRATGRMEPS
jgi:hypothetical protein